MRWEKLCKLASELFHPAERRGGGVSRGDAAGSLFITDHYRGWPAVLAQLSKLKEPECRLRLE
jgi:hypothetical protein